MFAYQVMTEQEAMNERFQLLKAGEYDAVVIKAEDKVSSNSGNPMIDLILAVYGENGFIHEVRDFLVFTKTMMWRVIHFADSAGLLKEYEEGKLCSDLILDKRLRVKIIIEEGREIPEDKLQGKPIGTKYFDKNKVDDYVKKGDQKLFPDSGNPFIDDDIVF